MRTKISISMKYGMNLMILLLSSFLINAQSDSDIRNKKWLEDISMMEQEMPKVHINLFHSLSRENFNTMISDLKANVEKWHDYKIVTEIERVLGMVNDGHSQVSKDSFDSTKAYSFHYFPIKFYTFDDGLYIVYTAPEWQHLIGMKLVAIENTNAKEVYKLITPFVPRDDDNEFAIKEGTRFVLSCVETLYGLGIINNTKEATYTLEDKSKKTIKVKLPAVKTAQYMQSFMPERGDNLPLVRQTVNRYYWSRYLPDQKALYIRYIYMVNNPIEPVTAFVSKLQKLVDSVSVEKIIVDVRNGQGGNIGTINPMINFLTQEKINKDGKLIILMDRASVSAHAVFLNRLEFQSNAVFIGEPNMTRLNFYSDGRSFTLPNSKIKINLATVYLNESLKEDDRLYITPHIRLPILSTDYFALKDPIMAAALAYKPSAKPLAATELSAIEGQYEYSLLKTLTIKRNKAGFGEVSIFSFSSTPYLTSLLYPAGKNKWSTKIVGLSLLFDDEKKQLILKFNGKESRFSKKEGAWIPAISLLKGENYDAFLKLVRAQELSTDDKQSIESYLNRMGYDALTENNFHKAIQVFELNTKIYPLSSNAFDSLGEAFMKMGDNATAIVHYKKAVDLNPANENAKKMLAQLQR